MLIIVEGPDGSGKTTLCNNLAVNGYTIERHQRYDNFSESYVLQMMLSKEVYVVDRMILTQWAYRILDKQPLDDCDFKWNSLVMILNKRYTKVIYCCNKNAYKYSIQRGEDNITSKYKADKLKRIYDFIISTLNLFKVVSIFRYDFEKQNLQDVIKFIGGIDAV